MVAFPARVKYDPTLVAPEWFRWLHKTRHDPPTPDELQQCAPARPPAGPRHDPLTPDELQQCTPARPHTGPRHNPPTPDELQQYAPARPHAGLGPWRSGLPPDGPGQWPAGAGEVQTRSTLAHADVCHTGSTGGFELARHAPQGCALQRA